MTTFNDWLSHGLIERVTTGKPGKQGVVNVTLHGTARLDQLRQTLFFSPAAAHLVAMDAASIYRKKLGCPYVFATIEDSRGDYVSGASDGTPIGMHWVQDGIEWSNGPFGPTDVYPHWGLYQD
jgi:hypothetical protein